ncbi:hypothetical protein Hanom_Chr05g00418471 [Helianthus anomalus]
MFGREGEGRKEGRWWVKVCPGFGPVMKRRLLEQNGAKTEHSSKLPDTARPCHPSARPCQAFRYRHSRSAPSTSTGTVKNQGAHDRAIWWHDRA